MSATSAKPDHDRPTNEDECKAKRFKPSESSAPEKSAASAMATLESLSSSDRLATPSACLSQSEKHSTPQQDKEDNGGGHLKQGLLVPNRSEFADDASLTAGEEGAALLSSSQTLDYGSDEVPDSTLGQEDLLFASDEEVNDEQ